MSCIRGVQRGTGSGNATFTIDKVDAAKAIALISGGTGRVVAGSWDGAVVVPTVHLTSSTTLTVTNAQTTVHDGPVIAAYTWQVVEFA